MSLSEQYHHLNFQQLKDKLKEKIASITDILENEDDEECMLSDLDNDMSEADVIFKRMDEVYFRNE